MKIFIIEDEPAIREELVQLLQKYGYQCDSSDDFHHIVQAALSSGANLILLDINLPYQGGFQVCREIRQKSNLPIIVLTSRNSDFDELMSLNIGADDYIAKPLLSNPKVSQRINQIKEQRAKDSAVRREAVEKVLYDIVMADPKDLYILDSSTGKVKLKRPDQMPKRIRNAMKKITNKKGEVSYEFTGKTEAARLLGAWNGWDAEKTINVKNDGDKIGELRIGFDENDKSDK